MAKLQECNIDAKDVESWEGNCSKRVWKLGKAFKNYRRTVMHLLEQMKFLKFMFRRWHRVVATAAKARVAGTATDTPKMTLLELSDMVWTDEDMFHFVTHVNTFERHAQWHKEETRRRRHDKNHIHYGKPMSLMMCPRLVQLWKVLLLRTHSAEYEKHFASLDPSRLLSVPLAVRAEEMHIEVPQISELQLRFFEADFKKALATHTLGGKAEIESGLHNTSGMQLWQYLTEQSQKCGKKRGQTKYDILDFEEQVARAALTARDRRAAQAAVGVADTAATPAAPVADTAAVPAVGVADTATAASSAASPAAPSTASPKRCHPQMPAATDLSQQATIQALLEHADIISGNERLDSAVQASQSDKFQTCAQPTERSATILKIVEELPNMIGDLELFNLTAVIQPLYDYLEWRRDNVNKSLIGWIRRTVHNNLGVDAFGSVSYNLALATSDYDLCLLLEAGSNSLEALEQLSQSAKADVRCTQVIAASSRFQTLRVKYYGMSVDVRTLKCSRAADGACAASDLMKFMCEQRTKRVGFMLGLLSFKLVAHHVKVIQRHLEARGGKFKAITLCFWAIAMLDGFEAEHLHMKREMQSVVGPAAMQSHLGNWVLLSLLKAFELFPWGEQQVVVYADGQTAIEPKTISQDVVVLIKSRETNSAANVTAQHVQESRGLFQQVLTDTMEAVVKEAMVHQTYAATLVRERKEERIAAEDLAALPTPLPELPVKNAPLPELPVKAQPPPELPVKARFKAPPAYLQAPPHAPPQVPPLEWLAPTGASTSSARVAGTAAPARVAGAPAPAQVAGTVAPAQTWHALPLAAPPTAPAQISQALPLAAPPTAPAPPADVAGQLPADVTAGKFRLGRGSGQPFSVTTNGHPGPKSPLILFLPGAGGEPEKTLPLGKSPRPCWEVVLNLGGNHKVRTPTCLIELVRIMRRWADRVQSSVVVVAFSRGAAWALDLCCEHGSLLDFVLCLAPYPWCKDNDSHVSEARQLMQVQKPIILLLHYASDEFCSALLFPRWHAQFQLAMEVESGSSYGQRVSTFCSVIVPGNHNDGHKVFKSLDFDSVPDDRIGGIWRLFWSD